MPLPPASRRLQGALEREVPGVACDETILAHLATFLEGDRLPSADEVVESWAPFLISLGACSDDEEAHGVCGRLLQRVAQEPAEAPQPRAAAPEPKGQPSPPPPPAPAEEETISEELPAWLEKLRLVQYAEPAKAWCAKMGAVNLNEVLENWQDFSAELKLKPLEKKRVEKDVANRAQPPAAGTPVSPAPSAGGLPVPAVATPPPSSPVRECVAKNGCFGPKEDPRRYALLEELGQGATATVYRCQRGEVQYAVKTISLAKLRLQRDFQRISDKLHREVSILFALRHPRIVSLMDVVEEPEKLHLVMELVEGGAEGVELFDYIVARGSFTEPVARYVFLQIVEGLKYIHSKDIVYRDLKPENILVDEKTSRRNEGLFEVKLSDFGHSKLINDGYSTALTRVGTPQYWAPEVNDPVKAAMGYDQTVDLWSLGVVLYVMLIGAYPFDGVGERIEDQIRRARFNFRSQASGREASPQAQDLIRSLIRVEPKLRLPLDSCRSHQWVAIQGGPLDKVMRPWDDSHVREERVRLPIQPSKDQVEVLRRDLHLWMKKFKCSAQVKQRDVIANLDDQVLDGGRNVEEAKRELHLIVQHHFGSSAAAPPAPAPRPHQRRGEPALPTVQEKRSFRLLTYTLRVDPTHGAGLDLQPERGGMRVENVYSEPGQPGLMAGDLITKINEVSLRGSPETVEEIFANHFCDGAQLAIKREC